MFTVNDSSQKIIDRVEQKIDIGVFFQAEAADFEIEAFLTELERLQEDNRIQSFQYFSKDHALSEMEKKFPGQVRFLQRYQFANPLQASAEVVPGEWSPDQIFEFLSNPRFDDVVDRTFFDRYEEKKEEVNRILRLLEFFRQGGIVLVIIFLGICVFLTGFFVSSVLQQKKREIDIMRLVGAPHSFIRLPFLLEGVALAVLAFILSFFLFAFFLQSIAPNVIYFFPSLSDQEFISDLILEVKAGFYASFWLSTLLVIIAAGIVAFLSVERFLRKRHLLAQV